MKTRKSKRNDEKGTPRDSVCYQLLSTIPGHVHAMFAHRFDGTTLIFNFRVKGTMRESFTTRKGVERAERGNSQMHGADSALSAPTNWGRAAGGRGVHSMNSWLPAGI